MRSSSSTDFTRRQFLAGSAAATLAGCTPAPSAPNLYKKLGDAHFIEGSNIQKNADDKPELQNITMRDLKHRLSKKATIVAFGYGACGDLCTITFPLLAQFDAKKIKTLVIDTLPENEGPFLAMSNVSFDTLGNALSERGVNHPITLYPVDTKGQFSNQAAIDAATKLDAISNATDGTKHTGALYLFDRDGTQLATAVVGEGADLNAIRSTFEYALQESEQKRLGR